MTCRTCRAENPDGFRFCGSCGAGLAGEPCPICEFANPAENRFCGQCGAQLGVESPSEAAPPIDERKLATVLFADVVGFTSLAERTDAEAVARTVDAAFRRLGEVVAEHGGVVDKYMGDSLMAVFGVPQTHDDDAERAVAAGLAMRGLGGDLAFSIGINTGEVIVTSLGRDGAITVLGDAVNVAARLEKTAGPGEVLVGPLTAQLASSRVSFRPRPAVLLKGKEQPVEVHEAVAVRPAESTAITRAQWPPLVGRDAELDLLGSQWRRVLDEPQPGLVLVTGEAGVGKTRLLEAFCAQRADEALVVYASFPAYGLMGGTRVANDIAAALGPSGDDEVDSRVRSITGVKDEQLRDIDPNALHQEQVWAMRRLLAAKTVDRPLVVVIDDIHRAGEGSLTFVENLFARMAAVPLLLVLVGRPQPPEWIRRFAPATTLQLTPLGSVDAATLTRELGCDQQLTDATAAYLAERSGGNPLYLRELIAVARETGQLGGDDADNAPAPVMPPTLRAILAARLDLLVTDDKLAIQYLAVLGQKGSVDEVAALGLTDGATRLHGLLGNGLLRHDLEETFTIADPLLAEVAYEALPHRVRAERHRAAARNAATAEERARHLDRATSYASDDEDLRGEAAAALVDAGCELLDDYRYADGSRLLQRAMELGEPAPETLLRLAEALNVLQRGDELLAVLDRLPPQASATLEAERVHLRASALSLSRPAESLALFDEAARRWSELGNVVKEAWVWANKGPTLFMLSRMSDASAALHRAAELFRSVGDRGGEHAALSFLGLIHPDDPHVADWLENSLRYAEEVGDRSRQVAALVPLAWHHYLRSRFGGEDDIEVAMNYADRLTDLAVEVAGLEWYGHGLCLGVNLARLAGRFSPEAVERVRQLVDDANPRVSALAAATVFHLDLADRDVPDPSPPAGTDSPDPVTGISQLIVFEALTLAGRPGEALARYSMRELPADVDSLQSIVAGVSIALAHVLDGSLDSARVLLDHAIATADALHFRPSAAAARALLAEVVLRADGDVDIARALAADGASYEVGGIAGALVLRADAVLGDETSAARLRDEVVRLRAPGLALGASDAA